MCAMQQVMDQLTNAYPALSPQLKRAAKYVLDRPAEVAVNSMRRVAGAAQVAPSSMLRLAKTLGYPSYEAFRRPFQESVRGIGGDFRDRAAWLQDLSERGRADAVFGQMAEATIANVEGAFRALNPDELAAAADMIWGARRLYCVSGGALHALANYTFNLARMLLPNVTLISNAGGLLIDDLIQSGPDDVMIAISLKPYSRDAVEASDYFCERGGRLIAVTDSRASPIAGRAETLLLTPVQGPLFFPSQAAVVATLETLLALVVSQGPKRVIDRIAEIDRIRQARGVYWQADKGQKAAK